MLCSMQSIFNTQLVLLNSFIDNHFMYSHKAACRQKPQEPVVKVVAQSSQALFLL